MAKPTTLISADWHLRRRADEHYACTQIVQAALKYKVARVIVAGDLIDRQSNRAEPINFLYREVLDPLEAAGVDFWYLQGQHDFDEPSWASGHRWAKHLHKVRVDLGTVVAYGLDFQPYGRLQEELAEMPESATLLVAHQGWGDWQSEERCPQGDFGQVPGHVSHVFTGDLHAWKQERHRNADGVAMLTCSPGAITQQKISEPAEHFYVLMDDEGHWTRKSLKSRVLITSPLLLRSEDLDEFLVDLDSAMGQAYQHAAANNYPEALLQPYLRVTYSFRLTDAVRRVEKAVAGRALLYWKELPPEEKQRGPRTVVPDGEAITPLSVLGMEVNRVDDPEVYELTSRLLQAVNPEEELHRWWHENLGE